ncbi:hypothetical protein ACJRO7_004542 [Eucalyptus globulus]|uniref:Uncharacterized protein n=1 Tax=Eucalyptus globulus TaxID=34317 RepID=A0ABD3J0I4_EUCGL
MSLAPVARSPSRSFVPPYSTPLSMAHYLPPAHVCSTCPFISFETCAIFVSIDSSMISASLRKLNADSASLRKLKADKGGAHHENKVQWE